VAEHIRVKVIEDARFSVLDVVPAGGGGCQSG